MSLSTQYFNGTGYTQFGLDVADYTLPNNAIANHFFAVKSSDDKLYILCAHDYTGTPEKAKLITMKNNVKTVSVLDWNYSATINSGTTQQICLSRDEQSLFIKTVNGAGSPFVVKIAVPTTNGNISYPTYYIPAGTGNGFAIYQDRYIWVASGTTVKIYDYTTKAELASIATTGTIAMCADYSNTKIKIHLIVNQSYDFYWGLATYEFVGDNIIQTQYTAGSSVYGVNIKQLLIDKYGDLIILTNSGTASTLLKYTTAGVQIGTTLTLGGAFYNLNTDKEGNYYYSNALGTYKIAANTTQGQAFTGVGTKIRGSGMTTYGNSICGYNPAVFGPQE